MDDSAAVDGERIVPVAALPPGLVAAVYRDLLQASFRPEELPGIEDFRRRYAGDDPQPSGVLLREGAAVGVYLCEAYAGGRALLLSHLAVSGRVRGGGIGGRLLGHLQQHEGVQGAVLLAELDDPRVWPGTPATGDPVARLTFYARHGARLLPLSHVQPRLQRDGERVAGMLLCRLDRDGVASPGLLAEFLTDYWATTEGPSVLEEPEVAALVAAAARIDLDCDLLGMEDWQRVDPGRPGV